MCICVENEDAVSVTFQVTIKSIDVTIVPGTSSKVRYEYCKNIRGVPVPAHRAFMTLAAVPK
jgi:hypothetical protein